MYSTFEPDRLNIFQNNKNRYGRLVKTQNGSCTDNDGDLDVNDTLICFEPRKIMLLEVQKFIYVL